MELTERKKKVLRSVVDHYIRTAEPVGSKAITELPDMNFSSATIRSEMADLTAMGYLEQPHTSAGRIPSPAGYRLYVDELMQDYRLSVDETKSINNAIEEKVQRVDKLVEKVAKLVSQATDLPAISAASVLAKTYRDMLMEHLERRHPGYGFARHKGYGTADHYEALHRLGPCRQHRLTFRGVLPDRDECPGTRQGSLL